MSGGGGGSGNGGGGGPPGGGDPGMTTAPSHAPPGEKGGGGYVAPTPSGPSPHVDRGGPVTYTTQQYTTPEKADVPSTESLLKGDVDIFEGTKEVIPTRGPMGDEMWDTKPDVPDEVKGGEHLGTAVINPHYDSPAVKEEQKKTDILNRERAEPEYSDTELEKGITDEGQIIPKSEYEPKDLTLLEHWNQAGIDHPALKLSIAGRLIYSLYQNSKEFITNKGLLGFDWDVNDPTGSTPSGGDGGGDGGASIASNITAPETSYIISGNTPASNSVAANWYHNLGQTSTNPGGFNLATEYAAAKTKVAQTLGTPSSYGWLAVNNSPFYNWLQTDSLNKGIL